jgi:hypothetical protein
MRKIIWLLWCLGAGRGTAEETNLLFAENFDHGLTNGWENTAFFKKPSVYVAERHGTNAWVHGVAEKTCSALTRKLNVGPPAKLTLRWRWKISGVATNGSERDIKKFDHAARVFIAFDTFIGPPRTLHYMWGNMEKPGTVLAHPKSERAQLFVLQSGNARAGQWLSESRDVTADWKKVFPGREMPRIVGIGLMTDSDSLGAKLEGFYADLELLAE